jgi:phage terminase small subunit
MAQNRFTEADILPFYNFILYNDPFSYVPVIYLLSMKLTRKQIKEGLEATPIDTLLFGEPKTLTKKQKAFCEALAKTGNKAEAYRQAYDTHSSPKIQSQEGQALAKNPVIAMQVEAVKLAIEANKYLLPAHLRALTIQKLTEKALDPDVNHAQQIKALELLGKITEVALFSERKEIITTDTSATAKDRLIDTLARAIRSSSNISLDKKLEADDLLAEITGGSLANPRPLTIETETDTNENHSHDNASYLSNEAETVKNEDMPTPPTPTPQNFPNCMPDSMHSIPDKQIHSISETPPLSSQNEEGEGVSNFWEQFEEPAKETPPLVDSGSPTPPIDISNPNWREV